MQCGAALTCLYTGLSLRYVGALAVRVRAHVYEHAHQGWCTPSTVCYGCGVEPLTLLGLHTHTCAVALHS